jgi:hypothetical protein
MIAPGTMQVSGLENSSLISAIAMSAAERHCFAFPRGAWERDGGGNVFSAERHGVLRAIAAFTGLAVQSAFRLSGCGVEVKAAIARSTPWRSARNTQDGTNGGQHPQTSLGVAPVKL